MKYIVSRFERVLKAGMSKANKPYSLDFLNVTISVPVSDSDQFGFKEITYQYGVASNYSKVEALRGHLPLEVDITLGVEMDTYGNAKTVITDLKALPTQTHVNK